MVLQVKERASSTDRRALILEQATAIVGELGYNGFSLQDLAQRCDLTKGGLLHHFPSKDQLLVAVLRERDRQDEIAVALRAGVGAGNVGDPTDLPTVLASLQAIVERNATRPAFVRLYAMLRAEALNPRHPAHAFFAQREAATLEMFRQMVAHHVARPVSVARQVKALMIGLELQWLREQESFDLVDEWARGIAALLPLPTP